MTSFRDHCIREWSMKRGLFIVYDLILDLIWYTLWLLVNIEFVQF